MSKILIVEDNKTEADALSLRLKAVGYKVFVGYNCTEGKRLLSNSPYSNSYAILWAV